MKYLSILSLMFLLMPGQAQTKNRELRIGAGYYGQNLVHPGLTLEFELDRSYASEFSLPLRANLGYLHHPDYQVFFLDVHKGFRKSFSSGFFLEQSLGAGMIMKSYGSDYWYADEYFNSIPHGNRPVLGFMPSLTLGAGFDLSREKDGSGLLWLRPKVFWDLGFRRLHQPYFALQVGYSHTIKSR